MQKTFVLDTNVLLHNPRAIFVFEDNHVVIPMAVIEEIDDQKKRQDEIGLNARTISRLLDGMRAQGALSQGVDLPGGGTLRIELNNRGLDKIPDYSHLFDATKPDNRILAVALNLNRDEIYGQVVLVSKDLNLRLKADVMGLKAEDFTNDKIDFRKLYSGQAELMVGQDEIDAFYQDKKLDQSLIDDELEPNQFAVMKNAENPSSSAMGRMLGGELKALNVQSGSRCFGLRPRNKEQMFALELLLDPEVKVVTLAGGAGTGKTLLALAAGLEQVLEQQLYSKLLVTRPVIPLEGQDLGYLPGDKEDKVRPWMQPIYDNLEFLFRYASSDPSMLSGGKREATMQSGGKMDVEDYLGFAGYLELEALTYIRGRSIPRQFILVDEAQNCTVHAIKTLLTRVGEGSKIIFTGDIEQIDQPYLDSASNGLTILVARLKDSPLSGHVTLQRGERSEVAELGARVL